MLVVFHLAYLHNEIILLLLSCEDRRLLFVVLGYKGKGKTLLALI